MTKENLEQGLAMQCGASKGDSSVVGCLPGQHSDQRRVCTKLSASNTIILIKHWKSMHYMDLDMPGQMSSHIFTRAPPMALGWRRYASPAAALDQSEIMKLSCFCAYQQCVALPHFLHCGKIKHRTHMGDSIFSKINPKSFLRSTQMRPLQNKLKEKLQI